MTNDSDALLSFSVAAVSTGDALTVVAAAFFAAMGLAALLRPLRIVALFGSTSLTRDGRNEVRAVYGGFGLAVAAMLIAAVGAPDLRPGVLLCVAVALAGMAAGRLVSFATDRGAGRYPLVFFAVELALASMLLAAYVL